MTQARRGSWTSIATFTTIGALATSTSPVPLEYTSMGFVGPVLLLAAIERGGGSVARAFFAGWLFSTVINAVELFWVVGLLEDFGHFPWVAAVPTAALLWTSQAVPYGIGGVFAVALAGSNPRRLWWLVPSCLVVATSLSPTLFPWRLGHSQLGWLPYVQVAELGGEPLVDLLVGLVAGGLYETLRTLPWRPTTPRSGWAPSGWASSGWAPSGWASSGWAPAAVAALAFACPPLFGLARIQQIEELRQDAPVLRVGVVQPNVGIFEKRDPRLVPGHLRQLQRATANLERRGADVVVWPESAYVYGIPRNQTRDVLGPRSVRGGTVSVPLLFGALTIGPAPPPSAGEQLRRAPRYNSVVAMDAEGAFVGISDKVELLAFGEYTPLWDYIPLLQEHFPRGLTPGLAPEVLALEGHRFGVLNCYEDVLPEHGRWVARQDPHVLVNVTNDAWFGDTTEPLLHQMVSRMRAIETRRDLIRAVNTGVSSHTTATGFDAFATETWVRDAFIAEVRLLQIETPWTLLGDWVTPLLSGLLLALAVRRARQRAPT